jgi:protein involved in polysaccharide export with SLBB domain
MATTTLNYGSVGFVLAADADVQDLSTQIRAAVQQGGGFVTVSTGDGASIPVLFTAGIPVWIATEVKRPAQVRSATVL